MKIKLSNFAKIQPKTIVAGKVAIQEVNIFMVKFQRTLENLLAAPTPIMAEASTWVVETGMPK